MKNATLTILLLFLVKLVASQECESDADCGENECCVDKVLNTVTKCEPLLSEQEICVPDSDTGIHIFACPCKSGLNCQPSRYEDIPLFGRIPVIARCMISNSDESSKDSPSNSEEEDEESEEEASYEE